MDENLKVTIDYLQNSEKTVYIHEISSFRKNKGNYTKPDSNNLDIEQGSSIGFDPDKDKTNQGKERPPVVGLMHEFGHAENFMKGKAVKYDHKNAKKGKSLDAEKGNQDEYNSIKKENIVRKKLSIEERSYEYYKRNNQNE